MKQNPLAKPSRTARKLKEAERDRLLESAERKAKQIVRKRDRGCRFPLCGCRDLRLRLEVSHGRHKGMGGNPSGDRSTPAGLVLLCVHRHQDAPISIHKGTLRAVFLTPKGRASGGFDGPIAWQVDMTVLRADPGAHPSEWREVAREVRPGLWMWTPEQGQILERLGRMIY